jgi:selenide,water dikinase
MGPGDLSRVLAPLAPESDPRLLVGHETFDDAGIVRVAEGLALVQTVDFFAPIVDDPLDFGRIAAANALCDIYAMGGEPISAMNLVAFPTSKLPLEVLSEILRGGQEKVHEAGAVLVGGHSVVDDEVKYGLSVTGRVDPAHMLTNAGATPGELLVLTKPIGTGLVATALKRGTLDPRDAEDVFASMRRLNALAARAARGVGARCATDITGFGLLGHASHIARASRVTLRFDRAAIPVFDVARAAHARDARTGGGDRNAEYVEPLVEWGATRDDERALLVDPQTSGGLLVAVPAGAAADYLSRVPGAVVVGEVLPLGGRPIVLA